MQREGDDDEEAVAGRVQGVGTKKLVMLPRYFPGALVQTVYPPKVRAVRKTDGTRKKVGADDSFFLRPLPVGTGAFSSSSSSIERNASIQPPTRFNGLSWMPSVLGASQKAHDAGETC